MVVRRYDKNGNVYYFNKLRGKRTSKRAWKISLAWKKKKKPIPPPTSKFTESHPYNQAAISELEEHLLTLKFKTFISWGTERKRVFKADAFRLKRMIEAIISDYMELAKNISVVSPHVIFWIKTWVSAEETELLLDHTDFVGVDPIAIPVYQIFKRYF